MRKKLMALLMAITLLDCNNQIVACASTDVLESEETAETESVFETEISFDNEPDTEEELEITEEISETETLNETVEDTTSVDSKTEITDETVFETEDVQATESVTETEITEEAAETEIINKTEIIEEITETITVNKETIEAVAVQPSTNIYTPDEVIYDAINENAVITTRCYDQLNDFGKYVYDEIIKNFPDGFKEGDVLELGIGGEESEAIGGVGYVPGLFDIYYNEYREEDNMGEEYCYVLTKNSSQYAKDYTFALFFCVIHAIAFDNPEMTWISDTTYQLRIVPYAYNKNISEGYAECKITQLKVYMHNTPEKSGKKM